TRPADGPGLSATRPDGRDSSSLRKKLEQSSSPGPLYQLMPRETVRKGRRMKDGQRTFLQYIETLFEAGAVAYQTDRQLLQVFTGGDRIAAELAFTVLVKRHGPRVYRACQAVLSDPHAAEDAFQATFLVLARKAGGLWVRGSLGSWLLSVA